MSEFPPHFLSLRLLTATEPVACNAFHIRAASSFRTSTATSLIFILSWGEFLYAISILTNPATYPISQQISAYGTGWSGLTALAVIGSLPILVVFVVAQKRLVSGLSLGAVK